MVAGIRVTGIGDSKFDNKAKKALIEENIKEKQLSSKTSSKAKSFSSSDTTVLLLKKTHDQKFWAIFEAFG